MRGEKVMGEEQKSINEVVEDISEEAFASLGLENSDLAKDKPSEEGGKVVPKHKPEDLVEDEEEDEEEEEEVVVEEKEDSEKKEEDEEVIPRSKYEKLRERTEKRIASLTAKVKEAESLKATPTSRKDKLEAMSNKELKQLKRDAFKEAKKTDDPQKEDEYLDLMDEVEEVLRTAPTRFQNKQVKAYEETVEEIILDPQNDDIDFKKESESIKKIASSIYSKHSDLHKIETGQAMALQFAIEHYREIRQLSRGKAKEANLKRKNTDLKRKTSLDSNKSTNAPKNNTKLKKLFKKGKESWRREDKEAFFNEYIGDAAIEDYIK